MASPESRHQVAFTLVELLVVVAIIGLLVALLLPAVQQARQAAQKSSCANNSRQIALALLAYEGAKGAFPASSDTRLPSSWSFSFNSSNHCWLSMILPFLEESALHDLIDFEVPALDSRNEEAAVRIVPTYRCPSYEGPDFSQYAHYEVGFNGRTQPMAIGNYVAIGAIDVNRLWRLNDKSALGIICPLGSTQIRDIKDGTSHTMLAAESREQNLRVWIDGRVGAFTTVPLGLMDTVSLNYAPYYGDNPRAEFGPSSLHSGGANHSFADGSVRFLSDEIEFPVYKAFTTYTGDEVLRATSDS